MHAETKERQPTLQQHHLGEGEGRRHDQRRGDVGQHMAQIDPARARTELADGPRIALRGGGDGEAAGNPGVTLPAVQPHQHHKQHERVAEKGEHRERQDQKWHARLEVDQHQHGLLNPAAEMRREKAQQGAEHRGDGGGAEGDHQADADRHEQPAQHIASQLVGAEQMSRRAAKPERGQQAGLEVERCDAARATLVREDGDQQDHRHPHQGGDHQRRRSRTPGAGLQDGAGHQRAPRSRGSSRP